MDGITNEAGELLCSPSFCMLETVNLTERPEDGETCIVRLDKTSYLPAVFFGGQLWELAYNYGGAMDWTGRTIKAEEFDSFRKNGSPVVCRATFALPVIFDRADYIRRQLEQAARN